MKLIPVLFFALLLTFMCGCTSKSEKPVLSETPAILSSSGPISENDLGIPIYPNAHPDTDQSYAIPGNPSAKHPIKTTSASLSTPDSVDQVENFYRDKLGSSAKIAEHLLNQGKLVDIAVIQRGEQIRVQIAPQAKGNGSVIVIFTQRRP